MPIRQRALIALATEPSRRELLRLALAEAAAEASSSLVIAQLPSTPKWLPAEQFAAAAASSSSDDDASTSAMADLVSQVRALVSSAPVSATLEPAATTDITAASRNWILYTSPSPRD